MARYVLIALNSPTGGEGDEDEYNRWYDEEHRPDLLGIAGAQSVRRFRIVWQNRLDKQYVALTEFESDDPDALMRELAEKASSFTDTIERTTSIALLAAEL